MMVNSRAYRLHKPAPAEEYPLVAESCSIPDPAPGELRIQVHVCGICHTDLHTIEGDIHPPQLPIIPGHQVVGSIEARGEGVTRWQVGDRVGVPWLFSACGQCDYCKRGMENLCPDAQFTGFHRHGGYAAYMLADARYVLPLPPGMSDLQVAPMLCAGIIGYRSLKKAEVQPHMRLGLVGFGASAHLAIQVAHYWGCEVYVFTRSEAHRRHADNLGAKWVGGAEQDPGVELDAAVIFAPAGSLVPVMLKKMRPGGTLAINAIHMSPIPSFEYPLIYGERTLRSVANATYQDGVEFLDLAARIPVRATVQEYPFSAVSEGLVDLKNSAIDGEGVLIVR